MSTIHARLSRPWPSAIQALAAACLCLSALSAAPQKGAGGQKAPGQTKATPLPKSVKPGINKNFLSDKLNIKKYTKTFETESREVFTHRHRIAKHVAIRPGMAIADRRSSASTREPTFCSRQSPVVMSKSKTAPPTIKSVARGMYACEDGRACGGGPRER